MNPLHDLHKAGQSIWLDFLRRGLITTGSLERMLGDYALSGVTSNPTIFGKAIGGSTDYDAAIKAMVEKEEHEPIELFYDLALADIQMAADVFRPLYERTEGKDGFVSFELEPSLAHDSPGSISKALELFEQLSKPNVMIKVPGTEAGIVALEQLTALGVNVNVTLLFSVQMYERVALAYIAGLERRAEEGLPIDRVASVASFFVSRVDTAVDRLLPKASEMRGKVAVANAKMAYRRFMDLFSGPKWDRLAAAGARAQKPLWASTGTKNPDYSDVLYIEELVGADTVNTMPQQTMEAFADHGVVRPGAVTEGVDEAEKMIASLVGLDIDLETICDELATEGIAAFEKDLHKLLEVIERKVFEIKAGQARWSARLGTLEGPVQSRLERLHDDNVVSRIWRRDHTVWKPNPEEISNRLGWLGVCDFMRDRIDELERFGAETAGEGFDRVVLLGMGGSSLAPQVLRNLIGPAAGALDLVVLDTTHPSSIAALQQSHPLDKTLFIVASKSGGTIETMSHFRYFFDLVGSGDRFIAISDPGTSLESLAREHGFRRIFLNPPDIGGRYSALSLFGLVPAALMGLDLDGLIDQAEEMAWACHGTVHPRQNPGAWLGAVLGEAAASGRDKLTFVLPSTNLSFGDWVEQLVAESTGKQDRGIVPVVGEDPGSPDSYDVDRLFVGLGDSEELGPLEAAGHPVVRLPSNAGLGAEFFRFEFATAVAGHILSINPFDQPNVAEAKQATGEILLQGESPKEGTEEPYSVLASVRPGDYVALQAYLEQTPAVKDRLHSVRMAIRDHHRVATTLGYGPRFLHSTGQLHKGGPASGVFLQIVEEEHASDLAIPGAKFTFGDLIDAQALGDLRSLQRRGRRVVRTTLDGLEEAVNSLPA